MIQKQRANRAICFGDGGQPTRRIEKALDLNQDQAHQQDLSSFPFEILFDGGCNPNPGNGYGSYQLTLDSIVQPIERLVFGPGFTSNTAELTTLIEALKHIQKFVNPASTPLVVRGDSNLTINLVAGKWKAKKPEIITLRNEAMAMTVKFKSVKFIWHGRQKSVNALGH